MRWCVIALILGAAGCAGPVPPLTEARGAVYACADQGLPQGTRLNRDCVERRQAYSDSIVCAQQVVTVGTPEHAACLRERAAARAAAPRL